MDLSDRLDARRTTDRLLALYNAWLAVVWMGLLSRASYAQWILAAHAAAAALPWAWSRAREPRSAAGRALRELYPLLWLGAFWSELHFLRVLRHATAHDAPIAALDRALFGTHLHEIWMPAMPQVALSELMHLLYFGYYPLIALPPLALALAGRWGALRDTTLRLMVAYLGCYLAYIAFPVDGPHWGDGLYAGPHTQGLVYGWVRAAQDAGDSMGTAFPSSHVVGAVTIAVIGWRSFSRGVAILFTAEAVGVALATVYTQNHFAIDAAAGIVVAIALQWAAVPALERALGGARVSALVPVLPRPPLQPTTRSSGGAP